MPKKRSSITLRGKAARAFVAAALVDTQGAKAADGTTGPMKKEIQRQQRGIFK